MVTKCSNTNYQMITKESYKDLKEYWDYQRKIEYNKEQIYMMAERFEGRAYNDFGPVHIDEVKELLWNKIKPDEFEEPPKGWIPKNEKYRLWNEIGQLSVSPTARKVVLRAKSGKIGKMPNILNDDNDI